MDLTGKVLKGRYCILEQIGAGGNGRLFLARDMELGCFWAVKEIPVSQKKEAKLLKLLEHAAMPRMIDYVERGDCCYLVMEYIRGKSLRQWMEEGRIFHLEELLDMAITMTEVLGYLHGCKPPVYYGDLKPSNLMLTPSGNLYLVDFGSAVAGYFRAQVPCQGTKGYAAPEQFKGNISEASDIYSLGKTLKALMGRRGFRYFMQAPGLFFFLWKCCKSEASKRYQTMDEAKKILEKIRRGRKKDKGMLLWTTASLLLFASMGAFLVGKEEQGDFWKAFTDVTDSYYEEGFRSGKEKEKTVKKVEERIHDLLRVYTKKEEQEYLLQLLEANGEMRKALAKEREDTYGK